MPQARQGERQKWFWQEVEINPLMIADGQQWEPESKNRQEPPASPCWRVRNRWGMAMKRGLRRVGNQPRLYSFGSGMGGNTEPLMTRMFVKGAGTGVTATNRFPENESSCQDLGFCFGSEPYNSVPGSPSSTTAHIQVHHGPC